MLVDVIQDLLLLKPLPVMEEVDLLVLDHIPWRDATGILLVIPDTCRNIVGNGSLQAQRCYNKPVIAHLRLKKAASTKAHNPPSERSITQRPRILPTIPILLENESFLILFFDGLVYAGFNIIVTGLPQQLKSTYHYNSIQVGLCYLSIGLGPLLIKPVIGRIIDANFHRHARALGIAVVENRQQDIDGFPIEQTRLQVSLAFIYLSSATITPYGWGMGLQRPPLPAALVLLFIMGLCVSVAT